MPKRTASRLTNASVAQLAPGKIAWDSEVPGLGLRVTPAGAKSFVFQFRTAIGEQGKLTLGHYPSMTIDQARKHARAHRVAVDAGANPSAERKRSRHAATVQDYADIYLGPYAAQKQLAVSTTREAKSVLNRFVLPKIGSRKMETITPSEVAAIMVRTREASGSGQANRVKAVLSKMFNLAIRDQAVQHNPCRGIENDRIERRWDHLTVEQASALLAACDAHDDQVAANAVRLLLFTGARLREVLKAEWRQFDLTLGIWTKPSAHTKAKRTHRLALAPEAVEIVKAMKTNALSERWLFPGRDPATHRVDFKRPWKAILSKAGIGHWRRHDLRRTTASVMLSIGEDITVIGKTLGHTQMQTTLSYLSLAPEAQRASLSRAVVAMMPAQR